MLIFRWRQLSHFYLVLIVVLTFTSCERRLTSREYVEVITEVSHAEHNHGGMGGGDPHTMMNELPPDHPDISGSMAMPAGEDNTQLQRALDASVARLPLSWTTPKGWTEEKGSSMRLATFRAKGKGGAVECSIVSLGGAAGGLQSNVVRWIKQINVAVPSPDQLNSFLSSQPVLKTAGGFSITAIDLTELSGAGDNEVPSMIGAIAELSDKTIFVKMTGSQQALIEQRDSFKELCQSLKIN